MLNKNGKRKRFLMKITILLIAIMLSQCAHACDEDELEPETVNFKIYKPCMSTPQGTNYCKKVKK